MVSKRTISLISIFASFSLVLGVSHHLFNFWGLGLPKEAFILVIAVPILFFLFWLLLNRIRYGLEQIEKKRWLFFFFPAIVIALILTRQFYTAPSVWHTIKLVPASEHSSGRIELYEIETPRGKAVNFSKVQVPAGWLVEDNALRTASANPSPASFSFFSPVGERISLLFLRSPDSRDVTVFLDGQNLDVALRQMDTGQKPVQMTTLYKMGISSAPILLLVGGVDFLAFFFLLFFIWLIQEISQLVPVRQKYQDDMVFPSHQTSVIILLALAFILHALNFLSVPLITASDSSSYLSGAIHWMQFHNLNGVPAARGPGTTFLFIPAFLLFGKNPWGVKMTLHLLSIGAVPMLYALGWRLYKRRSFAFFSGLIAIFMPEMYLFSNIVMSDVPNIFFVLAYCAALLSALERFSWKNLLASMLIGSFAVLLRPENILLLVIGAGFLFLKIILEKNDLAKRLPMLGIAAALAVLPLVYWSAHNYRVYQFFGLSNYAGEVLYDGWVYFGEASRIPITDYNSSAVQEIQQALNAYDQPLGETFVPTGWELYPALIHYGDTPQQAIKLFGDAAMDSIRKNPALSLQIYSLKLKKSFIPSRNGVMEKTFIPVEENGKIVGTLPYNKTYFFASEQNIFSAFIPWQRKMYDLLPAFDRYLYRPLVFFCLGIALLALYQKQFLKWLPLIAIALSRMFIPITIGIAHWDYMLAGIAVLLTFVFLAIQITQGFLYFLFNPQMNN